MSTLQFRPQGFFSQRFDLLAGSAKVGELDFATWKEQGSFQLDGTNYIIRTDRILGGDKVLLQEGSTVELARAASPGLFKSGFQVSDANTSVRVKQAGIFGQEIAILVEDQRIGTIGKSRWIGRDGVATLPDSLSAPFQAFVVWLALILWRRSETEAATISTT